MAESSRSEEPALRPLASHTEAEQEILAVVARTNGEAWALRTRT